MLLEDHNAFGGPNYFNVQKVVESFHVFHLEFAEGKVLTLLMSTNLSPPITRLSTYKMLKIELSEFLLTYRELLDLSILKSI